MNAQTKFDHLEQFDLRAHYENVAANTVRSILRHALLIASLVIMALVAAGFAIPHLPKRYTAEALVHPDIFLRDDSTKLPSPLVSVDGASLVASEARLIGSEAMVRAVVVRLGLDREQEPPPASSPVLQFVDRVRTAILPETYMSSQLERAIANVRRGLRITNDSRTYLISISFTAASPDAAASVANAFALEYVRAKRMQRLADAVMAASGELARRSAIYGERHPSIIDGKREIELARARLSDAVNSPDVMQSGIAGDGVTLAEMSPTPSSPKGLVILGLAFVSALSSGMGIALWLERKNTGSLNEVTLLTSTGVPCLGMVPQLSSQASAPLSLDAAAALREVALGAGLIGTLRPTVVAMITSTFPREGTPKFAAGLAKVLVSEGRRVLLLDTLSQQGKDSGVSLEDVLNARSRFDAFFEAFGTEQLATLRRACDAKGQEPAVAVAHDAFRRLLTDARKRFDVVLIAAPPVTLCAETVLIGHDADVILHVVRWSRTPLQAVSLAIQRFRDAAVHVSGIVLTDVNRSRWVKSPPSLTRGFLEDAAEA